MKLHVLLRGAATHSARKQVSLPSSPPTGSVGTLFLIAVSPVSSTEWKLQTQQMFMCPALHRGDVAKPWAISQQFQAETSPSPQGVSLKSTGCLSPPLIYLFI